MAGPYLFGLELFHNPFYIKEVRHGLDQTPIIRARGTDDPIPDCLGARSR